MRLTREQWKAVILRNTDYFMAARRPGDVLHLEDERLLLKDKEEEETFLSRIDIARKQRMEEVLVEVRDSDLRIVLAKLSEAITGIRIDKIPKHKSSAELPIYCPFAAIVLTSNPNSHNYPINKVIITSNMDRGIFCGPGGIAGFEDGDILPLGNHMPILHACMRPATSAEIDECLFSDNVINGLNSLIGHHYFI